MKNKIMMSFLVTLLITSNLLGCSKDVDLDNTEIVVDDNEEVIKKIHNLIARNPYVYRSDFYCRFLIPYVDSFEQYLTEEQINTLLSLIDTYKECETIEYLSLMDDLLACKDMGKGLNRAYNVSWLSEANLTSGPFHRSICNELMVLENLVGKDEFLSAMFQGNTDNIISLIVHNTSCDDKNKVYKLVQLFDEYFTNYDLFVSKSTKGETFVFSETYYSDLIKEIMSDLIKSKYENDEEFKASLFGNVLMNSRYFNINKMDIQFNHQYNYFEISLYTNGYGRIKAKVPSYYLESNIDINVVLDTAANNIIQNNYEKNSSSAKEMELLSYIVGWDKIKMASSNELYYFEKKEIFAKSLSKYFTDIEDFNIFLIALSNNNEAAIRKYMTIWLEHMMNGDITITKLLEYNSFRQNYLSKCRISNSDGTIFNDSYDDVKRNKYKKYIVDDFYFDFPKYDVVSALLKVENYFHSNGINYTEVIDGTYESRDWVTGIRSYDDSDISVLSKEMLLKYKQLNGNSVWYYVLPEGYDNGEVVSVYTNVLLERKETPVKGIVTEWINEETNMPEKVIIVAVGTLYNVLDDVHCKEDYQTVSKMKQLKIR